MFFSLILIVLILVVYRKQKADFIPASTKFSTFIGARGHIRAIALANHSAREYTKEPKKEMGFCFWWFLLYFVLAMISSGYDVNIINEVSNWLFLVLFPLLILSVLRKEKVTNTLKEAGLKRMDKGTVIRTLLICILYAGIIMILISISDEAANINVIAGIPGMLAKFPVYFGLMVLTAGFTEEFFFRGIIQRYMMNSLKHPYAAILFASILFGLYHFPFAFYLWEETAGNAIDSLKDIMINQAVAGYAFGLIYYKSNRNLWSSIILHAVSNAIIMSLGVLFQG